MTAQSSYDELMPIGFSGMLSDSTDVRIQAARNDDAASMAFGRAVVRKSLTDHKSADLPTADADLFMGILLHSHAYDKDNQLDAVGVLPGEKINVLRKGRVLVTCEDGCNVGDRLFIRHAAGDLGALRATDDGADSSDHTGQGEWESFAAVGGLAWLRVDFTNLPA